MATLTTLLSDLRSRLNELTARQWSDAQLTTWINEGARDLARRTECVRDTDDIAIVSGTASYTAPTDLVRFHKLELRLDAGPIYSLEYRDFHSMDQVWNGTARNSEGRPLLYTTWGTPPTLQLIVFPTPTEDGDLRLYYYRFPATLASGSDTLEIPTGWEDAVTTYAEMMALRRDSDSRWTDSKLLYEEKMSDLLTTSERYGDQMGYVDQWSGRGGGLPGWLVNG